MAPLYRVILPVSDIEMAARFYAAILDEPGRRVSPGRHYFGDAGGGGAILAVYSPSDDGDARRYGVDWRAHPSSTCTFPAMTWIGRATAAPSPGRRR